MACDEIVPFDPVRQPEIARLMAWANDAARHSIQLVTGAGGLGKTRLGYEFARQLQKNTWHSLWLGGELPDTWPGVWRQLCQSADKPLLLVIDYAEARQAVLLELLQALLASPVGLHGQKVRILMLARSAQWWKTLSHSADCTVELAGWLAEKVDGTHWDLPPWADQPEARCGNSGAGIRG